MTSLTLTLATGATYPSTLSSFAVPLSAHLALPDQKHLSSIAAGGFIFRRSPVAPSTAQVLLIKRAATEPAFPNLWETAGGGIDAEDATLLDGLVREVREETGLTVTAVKELVAELDFSGREGRVWRKYSFLVDVREGDDVVIDPVEHGEWGWFVEEEVAGLEVTTEDQRQAIMAAFGVFRKVEGGDLEGKL